MRRPIQWFTLSALLVAPIGMLVAQPLQEAQPAPDSSSPPFTPGDWQPGPAFVEGPADMPRTDQDTPLAPEGWVPPEEREAAADQSDATNDQGADYEIGRDVEPSTDTDTRMGPDGLHPLVTIPENAEPMAVVPAPPGAASDEVRIVGPDGQPPQTAPERFVSEPEPEVVQPPAPAGLSEATRSQHGARERSSAGGLRELRDYVAIRARPLFAPDRSPPRMPEPALPPEPVLAEPELPPPPPAEEEIVLETAPDWELVGMVRSNRLHSAMFRKFGEADSFSLQRGESRDGWTLDEIGRFEVVLRNEQGQARLTFPEN